MPKLNGINYQEAGQGALTLVCLHGISSNSRSWQHQLTGLSDAYRLIAWDAPGYGQSDDPPNPITMSDFADALAGLLNTLGLEQAVIVGLSMGGVIAQAFYDRHAHRVRALVLADTNTGGGARPEAERHARLETRLKAVDSLTPAQMAQNRAPAMLSDNPPPALLQSVQAMMSEIHPNGYRYAAIALDAADTRDILPQIAVPTLVLWGENDKIVPIEETRYLADNIPAARFVTIPGAGHLANFEQPTRFNQAVRHFLESL